MSFIEILVLIAGLLVAALIGNHLPVSENNVQQGHRVWRIVAGLVWMTVFSTGYQQRVVDDVEVAADTARILAQEVAHQERVDDYDNCINNNNIIKGEIERRMRGIDDAREELENLLDDPPTDLGELGFDVNDLQDPLLTDLFVVLIANSNIEYEGQLFDAQADLDRFVENLASYETDHVIIDCGEDPRNNNQGDNK